MKPASKYCLILNFAMSLLGVFSMVLNAYGNDLIYRQESLQRALVPNLILTPDGQQIDLRATKQQLGRLNFNPGDSVSINTETLEFEIYPNQTPYEVLSQHSRFSLLDLSRNLAVILPREEVFTVGHALNQINAVGSTVFAGQFNFRLFVSSENDPSELDDRDDDGISDNEDNCPNLPNANQADDDDDNIGNVCDDDTINNPDVPVVFEDVPSNSIAFSEVNESCSAGDSLQRSILVTEQFLVDSVLFGFTASHPFRGDVRLTLTSPSGTRVELISSDNTDSLDNYDVYLDDSSLLLANDGDSDDITQPFYERNIAPANALAAFNEESAKGEWTLELCDSNAGNAGAYHGASLIFRTGIDIDNDTVTNEVDCALLDNTRFQLLNGFVDTDTDGVGFGGQAEICSGNTLPTGFAAIGGDNCESTPNANQANIDGDSNGDACDADADNDGVNSVLDSNDLNPFVCTDSDADLCDDCSVGTDGFGALADNNSNNDGQDTDDDGQCDVSDPDIDGDGVPNDQDNCPDDPNPTQEDVCGNQGDNDLCLPVKAANGWALICL